MGLIKEQMIGEEDRAWERARKKHAKEERIRQLYEVVSDGITVWVNSAKGNLARFGRNGIDIHRSPVQGRQTVECLFCTHAKVTAADWELFVTKVREHHGIEVGDQYRPDRFRKQEDGDGAKL